MKGKNFTTAKQLFAAFTSYRLGGKDLLSKWNGKPKIGKNHMKRNKNGGPTQSHREKNRRLRQIKSGFLQLGPGNILHTN